MPINNTRNRTRKGIYPGSGVAPGGQQGRMGLMHNGATGTSRGGGNSRTSQRRGPIVPGKTPGIRLASDHAGFRPNAKIKTGGIQAGIAGGYFTDRKGRVRRLAVYGDGLAHVSAPNQQFSRIPNGARRIDNPFLTGLIRYRGARAQGGGTQSPASPAAPGDPMSQYRDSAYFDALRGLTGTRDSAINPLQAKITGLQAVNDAGQTLYDALLGDRQRALTEQLRSNRVNAAGQGLLRSGYLDKQQGAAGSQFLDDQRRLNEDYGQLAVNNLLSQIETARQSFTEQQRLIEEAAIQRARERQAAQLNSIYSNTLYPEQ